MGGKFALQGDLKPQTSIAGTGVIFFMAVEHYQSIAFALSGTWTGTVVVEVSNDNINWFSCPCESIDGTIKTATGSNTMLFTPLQFAYIRIKCTAWTSGTIVVTTYCMYNGIDQTAVVMAQGLGTINSVPNANQYPIRIAGVGRSSNPSGVSTGAIQELLMTLLGSPVVTPFSIPEQKQQYSASVTVNTDVVAFAAAGAGIRNYVTGLQLQNTGASATVFTLKDGSTVKLTLSLPASMTSAIIVPLTDSIPGTANAAINVNTATASTVLVNIQGFKQ